MQSDYERAIELIKAKRYEDAQALLMTSDHPNAEKLLDRVNKAIAARGTAPKQEVTSKGVTQDEVAKGMHQYEQERMRNGCVFGLMLLGAIFLCVVVLVVWTSMTYP